MKLPLLLSLPHAGVGIPDEVKDICPNEYDLHCRVRETERQCIMRALQATGGNRSRAADLLGISRKRLWEKIKELNVLVD